MQPGASTCDAIVDRLQEWLADRYGGRVVPATPVTANGDGFDSTICFVRFSGAALPPEWRAPLVVRVKRGVDDFAEAEREVHVHDWLFDRSYPTPRILHLFEPGVVANGPAHAMERAPGVMMLDALRAQPWRAPGIVAAFAAAHVRLHQLPPAGFPVVDDPLDRRLRLVREAATELDDVLLANGLRDVEALTDRLRSAPPSVTHGDFHPLNALVDGAHVSVIDWTDAGVSDRHSDIARTRVLFDVAAVAASNPWEQRALRLLGPQLGRMYLRAYNSRCRVDRGRVTLWMPVHLLHGWSQVASLRAGRWSSGPDDDRADRVPEAMVDELRDRFRRALAAASTIAPT
jgi:aminoglycoside phosphotransferase (APT) family kinase protein